ncbi:MAG: putative quinol monooxygenase [Arenicella sp.]
MSVIRINKFEAAQGKADELFAFLQSLQPYISSSKGCVSCEVLRHHDDTGSFVIIEKWKSIEFHKQSLENYPKEEMQAVMSLLGAPPEGSFYHP